MIMWNSFSYKEAAFNARHSVDPEPKPGQYTMHTHSHAEIFIFLGGGGVFHIEGTEYPLEKGDVLVMSPTESHYIGLDCTKSYERIAIHFDPNMFQALDPEGLLLKPVLDRKPGTLNLYKSREFQAGTDHYCRLLEASSGAPRLNVIAAMVGLLNEMYRVYLSRDRGDQAQGNTVEYQIVHYLNANLSSAISLDDICQRFYISKSQLCRLFKKATGTTIWQYVTIKRLAKAQMLLQQGEKPTKVCYLCGFNDYSAFYRAYMKQYGYGPAAGSCTVLCESLFP